MAKREKEKKEGVKFRGRRQSVRAICGLMLGATATVGFCVLSVLSCHMEGNGGLWFGAAGMLLFLAALIGLWLSVKSFWERDIFYAIPIVASGLSGLMTILYFILYFVGI